MIRPQWQPAALADQPDLTPLVIEIHRGSQRIAGVLPNAGLSLEACAAGRMAAPDGPFRGRPATPQRRPQATMRGSRRFRCGPSRHRGTIGADSSLRSLVCVSAITGPKRDRQEHSIDRPTNLTGAKVRSRVPGGCMLGSSERAVHERGRNPRHPFQFRRWHMMVDAHNLAWLLPTGPGKQSRTLLENRLETAVE